MALVKGSLKSDAIANLYRSAFYLAKGSPELGLKFFQKAKNKLGKTLKISIPEKLSFPKERLFLAEKILDEYLRLKRTKI